MFYFLDSFFLALKQMANDFKIINNFEKHYLPSIKYFIIWTKIALSKPKNITPYRLFSLSLYYISKQIKSQ